MMKRKLLKLDSTIRGALDRILPRNLTVRYLSALGAVAVLAIIGQVLIQNSLARQAENQARIAAIERQIAANDNLRKTAILLQLSSRAPEMLMQVATIQIICDQLDRTGKTSVFQNLEDPKPVLTKLLLNCRLLDSLFKGVRVKTSNYQIGAVTKALLENQTAYQASLRAMASNYELGMAAQIERFKRTELLLLFVTLLVLVLEGLYVFRPSVQSLYEALRIRSDFLGRMGHEVRNPMNSILGMANLLASTPLTEQQKKYLSILRRSSDGLLEMLNNLLDFSSVESGEMKLEKIPFNLYDLLCRSIDLAVFGAHAQGIELVLDIASDVPLRLKGDPARLQQVLANLLGNAIKFTPRGEVVLRVQIARLSSETAQLEFSVIDTGIGIEKEKTRKIFDAFVQEDSSVRRRFGGSGLGLSISREIVERFGGKLCVESEKGVGSRFFFSVDFARQTGADQRGAESVQALLDGANMSGSKVTVIEPNHRVFEVAQSLIEKSGGSVDRIERLADVVELFARAGSDPRAESIVIVDYDYARSAMPGLFSRSRRAPLQMDHFVFLIKTTTSPEELERLGELGVNNFLFKPLKPRQFIETLGTCLRGEAVPQLINAPLSGPSSSFVSAANEGQISGAAEPALSPTSIPRDERKLRVLVVDDALDNQFLIKTYLESTPYRLAFADDGRVAVEKLKASRFDIVLMDLQMPEMDGYTATQMLRAWEKVENLKETPVIAVSAQDNQRDRLQLTRAGFSDFLAKPVGPLELRQMILKHVPLPAVAQASPVSREINSESRNSIAAIEKHLLSLGPRYLANRRADVLELKSWMADLAREENRKKIQNVGHKLKGNAKSYGFGELGELGAQLEEAVKTSRDEIVPGLVRQIEDYVTKASAAQSSTEIQSQ